MTSLSFRWVRFARDNSIPPSVVATVIAAITAIFAVLAAALAPATLVGAAGNTTPGTYLRDDVTFYAYVRAGENLDATFTKVISNGSDPSDLNYVVSRPGAADQSCTIAEADPVGTDCTFSNLTAPQTGVWIIKTSNTASASVENRRLADWTINVQNGATTLPGRVWSLDYKIAQPGTGLEDFQYWFMSEYGYVYEANYRDYNGARSDFVSTAAGIVRAGTCLTQYRSVQSADATVDTDAAQVTNRCGGETHLFYEQPDTSLPSTAPAADGTTVWVYPKNGSGGPIEPTISNFRFNQQTVNTHVGTMTFDVTNFQGTMNVLVDANNDGDYNDTVDRTIPFAAEPGSNSFSFDGEDGNGNQIPITQQVTYAVQLDKAGEIHFMNQDVEYRDGGLEVRRLNGPAAGRDLLYWNDNPLSTDRCSVTSPLAALNGMSSTGGTHVWSGEDGAGNQCSLGATPAEDGSWGNDRIIQDWTFVPVNVFREVTFPGPAIDVVKSTTGAEPVSATTFNVPYTVKVGNTGTITNTNVQVTEKLDLTFRDGNPRISIERMPRITNGDCTANPSFNGLTDTRLLAGTDSQEVGDSCTIRFTVHLIYPNVEAVPTDEQLNTVYASSCTSPNQGTTFSASGEPLPPSCAIVTDASTDTSELPQSPNGDTPTPTPVILSVPTAPDTGIGGISLQTLAMTAAGAMITGVAIAVIAIRKHRSARVLSLR